MELSEYMRLRDQGETLYAPGHGGPTPLWDLAINTGALPAGSLPAPIGLGQTSRGVLVS